MSPTRQPIAYICLFVTLVAAVTTLALRLITRRVTKVSLWFDDYLAILAFLCGCVWDGLLLWWLHAGFGLLLDGIDAPADQVLQTSRLILWNMELFYAFSLASSKLAILAFYWRMFKLSNIAVPIQILASCALIWVIVRTFLGVFHCLPVQGFWDKTMKATCKINDTQFFFGTVLTHLLIDIAILILPVVQVRKLQLAKSQKLAIIAMFMFGTFVCIASIVVMAESLHYNTSSPEMPWNIAPILIWATAEVNLAVVSACLPMLRPIWIFFVRRVPVSKGSSAVTYDIGGSSQATKLTTFTDTKKQAEESDSTYELAGSMVREDSIGSEDDYYHSHVAPTPMTAGTSTVITGRDIGSSDSIEESSLAGLGGIMVRNETTVKVSKAR